MPTNQIIGTPDAAIVQLESLAQQTGANELMIAGFTHGLDERAHSLELLADRWFAEVAVA